MLPFLRTLCCFLMLSVILSTAGPAVAADSGHRPRIGLALSGGGSKGLAHIGVIKALEAMGFRPDMVAGTSMGSIIGGLYAAGYTPEQMTEIVSSVDWAEAFVSAPSRRLLRYDHKNDHIRHLLDVGLKDGRVKLPQGLISGYKLTTILTRVCLPVANITDFDQLPIPYRAVATDILTGDKVVLSKGNLALSMRASMCIPSVFPPFDLDGRLLVDGGVVENLPVETLRDMGADIVLAVNVSSPLYTREQLKDFLDIMDQTTSIQIVKSTQRQLKLADLVISPDVLNYKTFDFDQYVTLIQRGEEAAEAMRPQVEALLARAGRGEGVPIPPRIQPMQEITVAGVRLDGPEIYTSDLRRLAPFKPGQVIQANELDDVVQRLYGLGTLESVSYEVHRQEDDRDEIVFKLVEKVGTWRARLGLQFGFTSERTPLSQLSLSISKPNLFFSGSSGEIELGFGRYRMARAGMQISNRPVAGFFLRPEAFYRSDLYNIFDRTHIEAEYERDVAGFRLAVGQFISTWGEVALNYEGRYSKVRPRIATISLPEESNLMSGVGVSFGSDSLDRRPFPHSGHSSSLSFMTYRQEIGSDENYNRVKWTGELAIPLSRSSTLGVMWNRNSSLGTDPPITESMFLGGFPDLLGYAQDEFFGDELVRLALEYRWEFSPNTFLLLTANAGNAWEGDVEGDWWPERMYYGGAVGLAASTILGPVQFYLGLGEEQRYNLYVTYGYFF